MGSSSDPKGKSMMVEEEEILCPIPLAIYNPYQIQPGLESEDNDGEDADHPEKVQSNPAPRGTKSIMKTTQKGHYDLSPEDEAEIQNSDKVFKASPEFDKYKNSWIPLSERVKGWTIVTRERLNGGRNEKFYYHPSLTRQLRSKKQVFSFIRYGLVSMHNEGLSSSEAAENLVPEPRRQRSQTPKEAVEEFLAEARNNLNNYKG